MAGALCPSVIVDGGDLALSTFNRTVGSVVRFFCPEPGFILVGPTTLECLPNGSWNGTIPSCVSAADITSPPSVSETTGETTLATTVSADETGEDGFKIGTLIIVLWTAGAVLLITLIVLLICILRSHKKGRQAVNSSNIFRTRESRNHQNHGGVNPSFTSYDEIWTWIPVVTDSQANCTSQVNPQARENTGSVVRSDVSCTQTLTPPTYSEAMRQDRSGRNGARATAASAATSSDNVYDTIPSDVHSSATLPAGSQVSTVRNNEPSVPRSSALTQPQPIQSPLLSRNGQSAPSSASNRTGSSSAATRGSNPSRGQDAGSQSHASNLRQCSYTFYPQYTRSDQNRDRRNPNGFTHSDGSMFSYISGDSGRRVFCDVPPSLWDQDGPPPYGHQRSRATNHNSFRTAVNVT